MPLLQEVKYEPTIDRLGNIPAGEVPKSILAMLKDVRNSIGKLDASFLNADLATVLQVVETGKYELNGGVSTRIDLSSAKGVIKAYRRYSEGGCQSCLSLGRETIDAQDATSGFYCEVSDPDFDKNAIGRPGVRYEGCSPKVRKYYPSPCNDWKPRFSPKLEELISKE